MRRILWIFVIISPMIALAQSDVTAVPVITPTVHLARQAVSTASMTLASAVHAIQTLWT